MVIEGQALVAGVAKSNSEALSCGDGIEPACSWALSRLAADSVSTASWAHNPSCGFLNGPYLGYPMSRLSGPSFGMGLLEGAA